MRVNPKKWRALQDYCEKHGLTVTRVVEDLYTKMLRKEKWL